jgi:rhodanese-related sulfurtransferase
MGPFAPEIISEELNLVFALLIGIAFGFVLEQAGFSSSRRLAGLFYGRDFTVLRVFFTAAVTAMSGILVLGHYGLLDLDIIYINPLYLWAAIIGGVIMGLGFIIGGYCPGTSLCGAAIGKIDGMVFVLGGLLGVIVFGEAYPAFEKIFNGAYFGDITAPSALGISPGFFAFGMIIIAVFAFIVTTKIERKINPSSGSKEFPFRNHFLAGTSVVILGIMLIFLPDRKTSFLAKIADADYVRSQPMAAMDVDEVAFRILDHDKRILLIDVRDSTSFTKMALPGSVNISLKEMFGKQWRESLGSGKDKIFIAEDEISERKAFLLAKSLGYERLYCLQGGLSTFRDRIFSDASPIGRVTADEQDAHRFHARAGTTIMQMIRDQAAGPKMVIKKVKKVAGGCGS